MTYFPASTDKNLTRGDDRVYELKVQTPSPNPTTPAVPIDLTGARVTFTVKLTRVDGKPVHQDSVVIKKTSDDTSEVEILPQVNGDVGRANIFIRAADTQFVQPGVFAYDIQVRTSASKTYTVARGRLYLVGDITAAEDGTAP
jgi:hypothetical protein